MGLAFWRVSLSGHAAVAHQGVVPGFNSQIFLAPDDGVGVMAFTNGSRNAASWLRGEMEQLLRGLIGIPSEGISSDVPQRPDIWASSAVGTGPVPSEPTCRRGAPSAQQLRSASGAAS
jgi:hypothetical protein